MKGLVGFAGRVKGRGVVGDGVVENDLTVAKDSAVDGRSN